MAGYFDFDALPEILGGLQCVEAVPVPMPAGQSHYIQHALDSATPQQIAQDQRQEPVARNNIVRMPEEMGDDSLYNQEARARAAAELVEAAAVPAEHGDEQPRVTKVDIEADSEENAEAKDEEGDKYDDEPVDDSDLNAIKEEMAKATIDDQEFHVAVEDEAQTAAPTARSAMPATARSAASSNTRWAEDEECLGEFAHEPRRHDGAFDDADFGNSDEEEPEQLAEEEVEVEEEPQEQANEDQALEETTHHRRRERERGGKSHKRSVKAKESRAQGTGEHPPAGALVKGPNGKPTPEAQILFRQWQSEKQRRKNEEQRRALEAAARSEETIAELRRQLREQEIAREAADKARDIQEAIRESVELALQERERETRSRTSAGTGASSSNEVPRYANAPWNEGRSQRRLSDFEKLN